MNQATRLDLLAGIPVTDYSAALQWYERLLLQPTFFCPIQRRFGSLPSIDTYYIVQQPEHAGHARHRLFVENLDALVAHIAERGSTPPIEKPIRTACARSRTDTMTEMRSGSAALRVDDVDQ